MPSFTRTIGWSQPTRYMLRATKDRRVYPFPGMFPSLVEQCTCLYGKQVVLEMLRKAPVDLRPNSPGVSLAVYLNVIVCLVQHNPAGFVSAEWLNAQITSHRVMFLTTSVLCTGS